MIIKFLKKLFHLHSWKPIVSRYAGFEHRDIIYECSCRKRKSVEMYRNYYADTKGFPIETAMGLTNKEFDEILKNGLKA